MKSIKEKLHPISVWCIYSRYFSKDFREHSIKFYEISQIVNRKMISLPITLGEIIDHARTANKYLDFLKTHNEKLADLKKEHEEHEKKWYEKTSKKYTLKDKINQIKDLKGRLLKLKENHLYYLCGGIEKKIKELELEVGITKTTPEIEALKKEATELHKKGLYHHRNKIIEKFKQLELEVGVKKTTPRIEALKKEATELHKKGSYHHYEITMKLIKQLERELELKNE